jgi:hypothetical protein
VSGLVWPEGVPVSARWDADIYVIFDSKQQAQIEDYDEDYEGLSVSMFPQPAGCDDWYERSVGSPFFPYTTCLLMKSTGGEEFGAREMEWLKQSIQQNTDSNGPEELYAFERERLAENKIWVRICELDISRRSTCRT